MAQRCQGRYSATGGEAMNARPAAWLRHAQSELELAQLARDNGP